MMGFHVRSGTAIVWVWLSALVIALDQLTKWYIVNNFALFEVFPAGPFLDITRLHNEGAAFSLLATAGGWQRWFFVSLASVIGAAIIGWLYSLPARGHPWLAVGLSLILGGALGNAYDRLAHGHVVDFLHFHWNLAYFPAFNVADIAITSGAIMLIIDALLHTQRTKESSA
jgi:signal peptidase II